MQAPVEEKKEPVEEEEEEEVRVPLPSFPQQWANAYKYAGNAERYKGYQQDAGLGMKGKAHNHPMIEGNRRFGGPSQYWRPQSERYGARGGKNAGWVSIGKQLHRMDWFAKEKFLEFYPASQKPFLELNSNQAISQAIEFFIEMAKERRDEDDRFQAAVAKGKVQIKGKGEGKTPKGKDAKGKREGKNSKGKDAKGKGENLYDQHKRMKEEDAVNMGE